MNAYLLSSTCGRLSRTFNLGLKHIYKLPPLASQQACFRTSSVHWFHPRVSSVSASTQETLRKQYGLSDDYFVIYKEPRNELNHMVWLKYFELFSYTLPIFSISYKYIVNESLTEFVSQQDFYVGIFIVCVYLLGIRFFVNGFVKIIFHNKVTDVYRAYVLNKYRPTYKFVEFKCQDLKVINLSPSFPMSKNFFRVGKQNLILHDQLFSSYNEQEKLTSSAVEEWKARWREN